MIVTETLSCVQSHRDQIDINLRKDVGLMIARLETLPHSRNKKIEELLLVEETVRVIHLSDQT